jgi:broad specificity phosphatase PhoE
MTTQRAEEPQRPYTRRLWLVRHGATAANIEGRLCGSSDDPLSQTGEGQAQWASEQLRAETIAVVYSSDLMRASKTADIIAQNHPGAKRLIDARWREIAFGDLENMTFREIARRYPDQMQYFSDPVNHTPPNGESFDHLLERVQQAFKDLLAAARADEGERGDIVLVSHGGTLRALLCYLLAIPYANQWQLRIDNAALSVVDFQPTATDVLRTILLTALNVHPWLFKANTTLVPATSES